MTSGTVEERLARLEAAVKKIDAAMKGPLHDILINHKDHLEAHHSALIHHDEALKMLTVTISVGPDDEGTLLQ